MSKGAKAGLVDKVLAVKSGDFPSIFSQATAACPDLMSTYTRRYRCVCWKAGIVNTLKQIRFRDNT